MFGALKAIAPGVKPDAVIDRPKGCFPVPTLKHVREPFLGLMRGILQSEACVRRGVYERAYVNKLLANPEAHFTHLQGSKLCHLALLEWRLQMHVDYASQAACRRFESADRASSECCRDLCATKYLPGREPADRSRHGSGLVLRHERPRTHRVVHAHQHGIDLHRGQSK